MLSIHNNIKKKLDNFIELNKIPNIIFHGETGSGKKTILNQFLENIYKNTPKYKQYIMFVNCAKGKGIKFIRDELKFFAKTNIHNISGTIFKSIILLNAEKLTIDAQSALRRCIELFTNNTRFFIVIENKAMLIKPILSRFCDIYIPRPIINKEIVNLHSINTIKIPNILLRTKNNLIKTTFTTLDLTNYTLVFKHIDKLYNKGVCCLDLIKYIEDNLEESFIKYQILIYFEKNRYQIRNEKLLMLIVLNIYTLRNNITLENIDIL